MKPKNRKVEIVLDKCSKNCPFFYIGEGQGMCDDWCDCKLSGRRIHEYRNDIEIPFPKFCRLKRTDEEITNIPSGWMEDEPEDEN